MKASILIQYIEFLKGKKLKVLRPTAWNTGFNDQVELKYF